MTNLEWIRSLSAEELANNIRNNCRLCIYRDEDGCCSGELKCTKGILKWLNQEHKEEIKPCANCGGKAIFVADPMRINPELGCVQCCECHIRTPVGTKHDVVNIWNRRVDNAD